MLWDELFPRLSVIFVLWVSNPAPWLLLFEGQNSTPSFLVFGGDRGDREGGYRRRDAGEGKEGGAPGGFAPEL